MASENAATDESTPTGLRSPRFVGRTAELDRLVGALSRPPALVLVEGEAGIGKSRLVQEALICAGSSNRTLVAVCPPFREALTLGPVVDAIGQSRVRIAGLGLSALAGALRPLFPEWVDDLPPAPEPMADAGAARHRLMRALAELLDRMAIDVLVLEDLHWADDSTLEFVAFLASRRRPRTGLLLTYRPQEVSSDSVLVRLSSRLQVDAGRARIALGPLSVPQTAALVSSMLDEEHVSAAFAEFLRERTDGVPLAIEESVRLLRDRADIVRRNGEWVRRTLGDIAVPPSIRDAVAERAARLGDAAQHALHAVAVLAEPAGGQLTAAVMGMTEHQSALAVDEAVRSGLLVRDGDGRVAFRHALAAKAVYEPLPDADRRLFHHRAGHALEAVRPPPVARLAHHFREAGDTARWCRFAEQAADLALGSGDHRTAVTLLHDLLTEVALPAEAVVRLAEKMPIFAFSGYAGSGSLLHRLRAMADSEFLTVPDRSAVRSQLGRMLMHAGEYAAGAQELERAVPGLADRPLAAARAMMVLGSPAGGLQTVSVHRQWLDRAAAIVTLPVDADDRLVLLVDRATALLDMGDEAGWTAARELPQTPTSLRSAVQLTRASLNIGNAAMRWGQYGEARRRLTTAVELAEKYWHLRLRDMALATLVHLDWFTGAWDGLAERAAVLAGLDGEPLVHLDALLVGGFLDMTRGTPATAEERLRIVLDAGVHRGIVDLPLEPAAVLAQLRLAEGRIEDALKLTEEPMRVVAGKEIWVWATEIAPARVAALLAAGRTAEARQLVAEFTRGLASLKTPAPRAALRTCRALLAEADGQQTAAAVAWGRAATSWQELPRPYDALLARERQARALLAAGSRTDGLALLAEVVAGLSSFGAQTDADRLAPVLREHAASPGRSGRRGYGDQLSPRELEVVRLVLTGLTNPEIARVLSRSPKTVAAQLNSAMRKHGVTSRTALAVRATRAGIQPADGAAGESRVL